MLAFKELLSQYGLGLGARSDGEARFDRLQVGSVIAFGQLPQAQLSGKRFVVKGINSYFFGKDHYISFVVADKERQYQMIVAEPDKEQRYLAISRRLSIEERAQLFDVEEFQRMIKQPAPKYIACRSEAMGFKGWVVGSYKPSIDSIKGRFFQSDARLKGFSEKDEVASEFDYTMFTSDNDEHAIEVERYDDGRVMIYATVFRPAMDVEFISGTETEGGRREIAPKLLADEKPAEEAIKHEPPVVAEGFKPQLVKPIIIEPKEVMVVTAPKPEVKPEAKAEPKPEAPSVAPKQEQVIIQVKASTPIPERKDEPVVVVAKPVVSPPREPVVATVSQAPKVSAARNDNQAETLECDIHVASKIIDEAIKNEITLAELVRKVVDLPVRVTETIQFNFPLSDEDCKTLGKRYGIDSSDKAAIKARIVEDIASFAGAKDKK